MPAFPGNRPGGIVRIGVLELDLASGELRKNGRKLRLQEQPLQVLTLLLERAGDVSRVRRCARNFGRPTLLSISITA